MLLKIQDYMPTQVQTPAKENVFWRTQNNWISNNFIKCDMRIHPYCKIIIKYFLVKQAVGDSSDV